MSEAVQEQSATDAPNQPDQAKTEAKPTETVDFWKQKAREQEARAKSNAEAAKRLAEYEESQKTAEQKAADAAQQAQRELQEARSEAIRYRAAATHRVSQDNFDLLGVGTEDEIAARAQRIGQYEAAFTELGQLRAELAALKGAESTPRPIEQLQPGKSPSAVDDSYPASWFPSLRSSQT